MLAGLARQPCQENLGRLRTRQPLPVLALLKDGTQINALVEASVTVRARRIGCILSGMQLSLAGTTILNRPYQPRQRSITMFTSTQRTDCCLNHQWSSRGATHDFSPATKTYSLSKIARRFNIMPIQGSCVLAGDILTLVLLWGISYGQQNVCLQTCVYVMQLAFAAQLTW